MFWGREEGVCFREAGLPLGCCVEQFIIRIMDCELNTCVQSPLKGHGMSLEF